jgi:hypothetical protein
MITKLLSLNVVIALLFINAVTGQTISGKIIDNASKEPLAGVSIKVAGTSNGATTDANGAFTVKAGPQSKLDITQVGYAPKRVSVNGEGNNN